MQARFIPGNNIAIKVPTHEYEDTVVFYRDILGFEQTDTAPPDNTESTTFRFGDKILWIDRIAGISQAEIWLEVLTDDMDKASDYLNIKQCNRRDEIEPLPEGLKGFWISSPSNIIHLIHESGLP